MHISKSKNSKLNYFIPLLLGITTFFLIIGPKALNPLNIQWLLRGDALEDYLGWAFFKNSSWMFPPGLNPKYGLEISSSIVFSDSIPLLSFFFKGLVASVFFAVRLSLLLKVKFIMRQKKKY